MELWNYIMCWCWGLVVCLFYFVFINKKNNLKKKGEMNGKNYFLLLWKGCEVLGSDGDSVTNKKKFSNSREGNWTLPLFLQTSCLIQTTQTHQERLMSDF